MLNSSTPVLVTEGEPLPAALRVPDAEANEQQVIPPLGSDELAGATRSARRRGRRR